MKKDDSVIERKDELLEEEKNEKFYLIHTTNENCSLLIYEIVPNGSFNDLLDNNSNRGNHLRIFQAFKNVYYVSNDNTNISFRKSINNPMRLKKQSICLLFLLLKTII